MIAIDSSTTVGKPQPLDDVATQFDVSRATMWRWISTFGITRYRMPGKGKLTYIDPDEVRRKLKPRKRAE